MEKAGCSPFAKTDMWVPDVEAFARYSYANNVPFLARNFGTFGIHFGFDVFDAGARRPRCVNVEPNWLRRRRTLRSYG